MNARPATLRLAFFAAAMAAMLAGCSRESNDLPPANPRVKLPGFSIELPPGEIVETSTSPSTGRHFVKLPTASNLDHWLNDAVIDSNVEVDWSTQSSASLEEWLEDNASLFLFVVEKAIPGAKILSKESLSADRWLVIVGTEEAPLGIGVVRCDPRFEVQFAYARYHNLEHQIEVSREMLRSVHCEVLDINHVSLVAATRLPEKFGRVVTPVGQGFRSLDGEMLLINFTTGDLRRDEKVYRIVLRGMLKELAGTEVPESRLTVVQRARPESARGPLLLRAALPEAWGMVYVGRFYCEHEQITMLTIWNSAKPTDALAWERLDQVGCPGGESTSLPLFESVAASACEAGDESACTIKSSLQAP
jgi:hypothetical protein